jgi:hypothetical protein
MKIRLLAGIVALSLWICSLASPSQSQSFSVGTTVAQNGGQYSYAFTLNYDQAGQVQTLTDSIYDWSFFVDPATPLPTDIKTPAGWIYSYDPASGQFDFYTEGPNGFGNGDFGPDVILPGASLSGFGLTTPAAPDQSIAFATDEQFNQDATTATLPTSIPLVPEASTWQSLGALLLLGGFLSICAPRKIFSAFGTIFRRN